MVETRKDVDCRHCTPFLNVSVNPFGTGIGVSGTTVLVKTAETAQNVLRMRVDKIRFVPARKDGKDDSAKVVITIDQWSTTVVQSGTYLTLSLFRIGEQRAKLDIWRVVRVEL